jgi:hypothetical protein
VPAAGAGSSAMSSATVGETERATAVATSSEGLNTPRSGGAGA